MTIPRERMKITYVYNKERFIREGELRWKMEVATYNKRMNSWLIITGAMIAITGLCSLTGVQGLTFTFACMTVGLIIFCLYYLYALKQSKKNYFENILQLADTYEQQQMDFVFECSETSVKYQDKEKQMESSWELFSSYSFHEHYLMLAINRTQTYLLKEVTEGPEAENFRKIKELVQAKLPFREIR